MSEKVDAGENLGSSHGSTFVESSHNWLGGGVDYPGDSVVMAAINEHIQGFVRMRHMGLDLLASCELDCAQFLIEGLRKEFSL